MEEIIRTQKIKKFFGEPVKQTCSNVLKTSHQESNIREVEENMPCLCGHCFNNMPCENNRNMISNHSFRVNDNCNFKHPGRVECPSFMRNKTLSEIRKFPSNINLQNKDTSSFLSRRFGLGSKRFFDNKLNSGNCKYKGFSGNSRNEYCRQGNLGKLGLFYKDNTLSTISNAPEVENLQESTSNSIISGSRVTNSLWARNSTLPTQLPGSYNCARNLSNVNPFNVISFSRNKESDVLTKSRYPFYNMESQKDNCSITSSIVRATSGKAQMTNLLENLHQRILNISPYLPVDAVRVEFEWAKEELESVADISFAHTIRDGDGVSIASNFSKVSHSVASKRPCEQISVSLKSAKEVLRSLQSASAAGGKPTEHLLERRKDSNVSNFENDRNTSDNEDSALLFKKPKPFARKKKLSSSTLLKIKTPPAKNLKSKVTSKMFSLKHWRPFPMGSDLLLCGVNDSGETIKTEAIKKRINNSLVELIGGTTCKLIGSPVSTLPKGIILKLENGIPRCWKLLQKELVSSNISENHKAISAGTESEKPQSSKTRKSLPKKRESFKASTAKKKSGGKKKKDNKTPQCSSSKSNKLDVTVKESTPSKVSKANKEKINSSKVGKQKKIKCLQPDKTPDSNKNNGQVCKTRSGRVVVPPHTYDVLKEEKKEANSSKQEYSEKINRKRDKEDVQQSKSEQPSSKKKKKIVDGSDAKDKKTAKKNMSKSKKKNVSQIEEEEEGEEDFELNLDDILIPQMASMKEKMNLSRSQLKSINLETPPLKYFNRNLNLLNSVSSAASPDWCISQRTASEVKRFQKRKATNCTKKITNKKKKTTSANTTGTPKKSNLPTKDLKNIVDWFADKDVKTPVGNSRVVKYMISKRKNIEEDCSETEDKED